jgi:hypothetical protein
MTGSKHNHEGPSSDKGEPGPGQLLEADASRRAFLVRGTAYGRGACDLCDERRPGMGTTRAPVTVRRVPCPARTKTVEAG